MKKEEKLTTLQAIKFGFKNQFNFSSKPEAWGLFLMMLMLAFFSDSSVVLLDIPSFEKLSVYEGEVSITNKDSRRGYYLALKATTPEIIEFTCWISSSGSRDCLPRGQRDKYIGKSGKVYFYRGLINGFFYENRLLQFEVDGDVIISYEAQKEKYLHLVHGHMLMSSLFVLAALIWLIRVYRK